MNKRLCPLTENHLFTIAYRKGSCDVNKLCAVYVMKNIKRAPDGNPLPTRLGIAVNAKLGGAVQRNRVKRIIREGYRKLLPEISPGLIIVISARGAIFSKHAKSTGVMPALDTSFKNLGVYSGQTLVKKSADARKTFKGNKGQMPHKNGKSVKN